VTHLTAYANLAGIDSTTDAFFIVAQSIAIVDALVSRPARHFPHVDALGSRLHHVTE